MVNTDVRKLMLFEFNRALSYISEIVEIKRNVWKLEDSKRSLDYELYNWQYGEDFSEEEEVVVKEIIADVEKRVEDIRVEIEELEKYKEVLTTLVSKIIEAITKDENLLLERSEIRKDMLEEYVYLLCDIAIEVDYMEIDNLFEEKVYFIVLLVEMYGEDATELIEDILNEEIGNFGNYFN